MRRATIAVFLCLFLALLASSLSGCAGDPIDDIYTMNLYPGSTDTYDVGSAVYRYDTGFFREIWLNGALLAPGVIVETDPVWTASPSFGITALDIAGWNGLVSSQWTTDATGIHYDAGNVGIGAGGTSEPTVNLFVGSFAGGLAGNTALEVHDNCASAGTIGILATVMGGKSDDTYGIRIENLASSGTAGADKFGLRIRSDGVWVGAGATNYGLYLEDITGGTDNYAIYSAGGKNYLAGATNLGNSIDWSAGNVTYVPLTGDIQTYVNAAVAGDTLVLASGEYVITSTITVNKQLNIIGQGNAGFYTIPAAPAHGTVISSVTDGVIGFDITSSNVSIAHLSQNLRGAASTGINTANNLTGIVLQNIDVIVTCANLAQGFTIYGSNAVLRDLTFYVTSTNSASSGLWIWNDLNTTQNAVVDCFNVTGTAVGAGSYAYAFACENINDGNTITLNLSNSVCKSLTGTPLDVAVASISTTTSNAVMNSYLCTFDGADYDAYQTGANQLNLGGSVLVNNLTFGTVTYRATMASGTGVFGGTLTLGTGSITDSTGAISFGNENLTTTGTTTTHGFVLDGTTIDSPDSDAAHFLNGDGDWIGVDLSGYLAIADIDDVPVDGVTNAPISSNWAYDHNGGGLSGVSLLTMTGNISLTSGTDNIYQKLDPNGANRTVTLVTGVPTGSIFVIQHTGSSTNYYLSINEAADIIDRISQYGSGIYVFDGTHWQSGTNGAGGYLQKLSSVPTTYGNGAYCLGTASLAVGSGAYATGYAVSLGAGTESTSSCVSIGAVAKTGYKGIAIGCYANAQEENIAIGYYANADTAYLGLALGYYSKTIRYGETSVNMDGNSSQKNNAIQVRLTKTTTNNTPVEMLCGGIAAQRLTIRASSALACDIKVVARDNVAGHVASYSIRNCLIKRDAANNTVLVSGTVTVDYEDDAAWDCTIAADDVNEALVITVTGDDTNPTQWAAVVDGVETHY